MFKPGVELRGGYLGRDLEIDIIGKPKFSTEYTSLYKRYAKDSKEGYISYALAQKLIRECYLDDPTSPEKEFSRDLRLEICEELGLEGEEGDGVRFYSAVGTPLDLFHGVDAWFEIDINIPGKGMQHVEFSIDATLNPAKILSGYKADLIVGDIPEPSDKKYLPTIEGYTRQAVDIIIEKLRVAVGQYDQSAK